MPRIHLISAMYSSKGHAIEYVRNFSKNLIRHFEITLYIATTSKNTEHPKNIDVVLLPVDYAKTDAENYAKFSLLAPYLRAVDKQVKSLKYYSLILKKSNFGQGDIVFIMDYDVIPLIYLVAKLKRQKIRIFLWVHSARFKSKDIIYQIYKSIFKFIFTNFINKSLEKVIVNGDYIKTQITHYLKLPKNKVIVIQYPSEIKFGKKNKLETRKELGFHKNDKIVLFFGMLRNDKNIELLIKSVAKSSHDLKLIIAGSEASVSKLEIEEWILKHDLDNYYLDINYISEENMANYYSCSDLLMLTYSEESGSQSGPLSLAREFLLPALVTDSGEIGHYVKTKGIGLVANQNNNFINRLDYFFNNYEPLKTDMEEKLLTAKKNYSWEQSSQKYINLFNESNSSNIR